MNSNIKNNILQIILGILLTGGIYFIHDFLQGKHHILLSIFQVFEIFIVGLSIWGVFKSKWKFLFGTFITINLLVMGAAYYLYQAIKSVDLR